MFVPPVAALALLLSAPPGTADPAPAAAPLVVPLIADPAEADVGPVAEGPPVGARFAIANAGSEPLRLVGVKAGCSCQAAEGLPERLAAGAAATLRVTMNTRDRVGPQRGWWEVLYRPDGDDGGEPRSLRLTLTATITAAGKLEPTPAVAQFGAVERGEAVSATNVLAEREPSGEAVAVRDVRAPDWLTVQLQRATDGPPRYRLILSGTPPGGPGRAAGEVEALTDHPRYGRIEVPFEAFVRGDVTVEPRSVVQIIKADGTVARPAVLTVRPRRGATIRAVAAGPAGTTEDEETTPGIAGEQGAWRLALPDPPADGPRAFRDSVLVEVTTDRGTERHVLPRLVLRTGGVETAAR